MKNFTGKIKDKNGNIFHFYDNSFHRTDGPAIEYANGDKEWYKYGKKHREDGPAVIYYTGKVEWWLHGKQYESYEELMICNIIE